MFLVHVSRQIFPMNFELCNIGRARLYSIRNQVRQKGEHLLLSIQQGNNIDVDIHSIRRIFDFLFVNSWDYMPGKWALNYR